MIPLPKWIKDVFEKGHCPHCKEPLFKKGVHGVGIREEKINKKQVYSFCYDYLCIKCNQRTVFTGFPTSFEDFIGDLIDIANLPSFKKTLIDLEEEGDLDGDFDDGSENTDFEEPKKSLMSQNEIRSAFKMIKDSEYFEDLLDQLGIKKLGKEDKKDEDK